MTLRSDHPDIEKFIEIKTGDVDMVKYSNISVLLTDDFMDAVQSDSDFDYTGWKNIYNCQGQRAVDENNRTCSRKAEPGLFLGHND